MGKKKTGRREGARRSSGGSRKQSVGSTSERQNNPADYQDDDFLDELEENECYQTQTVDCDVDIQNVEENNIIIPKPIDIAQCDVVVDVDCTQQVESATPQQEDEIILNSKSETDVVDSSHEENKPLIKGEFNDNHVQAQVQTNDEKKDIDLDEQLVKVEECVPETSQEVVYPSNLLDNLKLLDECEKKIAQKLIECGQEHLFNEWDAPGVNDEKKKAILQQIKSLDENSFPIGGIEAYITRAKALFELSLNGASAYEGMTLSVPPGIWLEPSSPSYLDFEAKGFQEIRKCAFVVLAGGLSERLGSSHVKALLPTDTITNTTFLELCIKNILAYEKKFTSGVSIPLLIMVSENTVTQIVHLLEKKEYFGLSKDKIIIAQQDQVPAFQDREARLATSEGGYALETKPHGHGDIHALLHRKGIAEQWLNAGFEWMVILHDNNSLGFFSIPACLGVSKELDLEVNAIAVPRKAKQPLSAIVKLQSENKEEKVVSVKYHDLDKILRSTHSSSGDIENPATGYSLFPGSTNQLIFKLSHYVENLKVNQGIIPESVYPQYVDESRITFRRSIRLESRLQDYLKTLHSGAKVGFTGLPEWLCYSPVKNNWDFAREAIEQGNHPATLATAEADRYRLYTNLLELIGVTIGQPSAYDINGFNVSLPARVIFDPFFISSLQELKEKFPQPTSVSITSNSSLVVSGTNVIITSLNLSGSLVIDGNSIASVYVSNANIQNAGRTIDLIPFTSDQPDHLKLRGFTFVKGSARRIFVVNKDIILETPIASIESNQQPPLTLSNENPQVIIQNQESLDPEQTKEILKDDEVSLDEIIVSSQFELVSAEEKSESIEQFQSQTIQVISLPQEYEVEFLPEDVSATDNDDSAFVQVGLPSDEPKQETLNTNETTNNNTSQSNLSKALPQINPKTEKELLEKLTPSDAQGEKCTCSIS